MKLISCICIHFQWTVRRSSQHVHVYHYNRCIDYNTVMGVSRITCIQVKYELRINNCTVIFSTF